MLHRCDRSARRFAHNQHYQNVPFEIPNSWEWVRLGQLYNAVSAKRVLQAEWQREGVPFYRAREIVKLAQFGSVDNDLFISEKHYQRLKEAYGIPQPNDIMLSAVGTIGKSYVVKNDDRFYYKDASVLCLQNIHSLNSSYIQLVLSSQLVQEQMYDKSKGTTVDTITIEKVGEYTFPLPPLAEQIRIVGAVGQWFDVADNLESNKQDLQETVLQAKSKVLEIAIQGKLVPQDPNDEPAAELLKRIAPHAVPCDTSHYENLPFAVPQNWAWVQLGMVAKVIHGRNQSAVANPNGKYPIYGSGGIMGYADDYLCPEHCTIIGRKGTINNPILVETKFWNVDTAFGICPSECIDYLYLYYFCKSFNFTKLDKSTTLPSLTKTCIEQIYIPLPPLAEQMRIVAKVRQLLNLLDKITAEL